MTQRELVVELNHYMSDDEGSDYYNVIQSLSLLNRDPQLTTTVYPGLNLDLTRKLEKNLVESIDRSLHPEKTLAFVQSQRLLKGILL